MNPYCSKLLSLLLLLVCCYAALVSAGEQKLYSLESRTLGEFARLVSEETGMTILFAPRVRQQTRFDIYNPQPMTADELYQIFQATVQLHGYGVSRHGNIVRVIRKRNVRQQPNQVFSEGES